MCRDTRYFMFCRASAEYYCNCLFHKIDLSDYYTGEKTPLAIVPLFELYFKENILGIIHIGCRIFYICNDADITDEIVCLKALDA